jgi:hypothetical protein
MVTGGDPEEIVPVTFVIPIGQVGFLGSPGEFQRAQQFGSPISSFESRQTLPVGDGRRELRLFALPAGVVMREDTVRVPGFNILILHPGEEIVVRVARSALAPPEPRES